MCLWYGLWVFKVATLYLSGVNSYKKSLNRSCFVCRSICFNSVFRSVPPGQISTDSIWNLMLLIQQNYSKCCAPSSGLMLNCYRALSHVSLHLTLLSPCLSRFKKPETIINEGPASNYTLYLLLQPTWHCNRANANWPLWFYGLRTVKQKVKTQEKKETKKILYVRRSESTATQAAVRLCLTRLSAKCQN